jgi:hypothetical protein
MSVYLPKVVGQRVRKGKEHSNRTQISEVFGDSKTSYMEKVQSDAARGYIHEGE